MNRTYKVKLDTFEGPLDLLLHLVNELEIDIYDIPVAKITEQYMDYVYAMQRIELNIASEYLVMAATLLEIKSAMLLPKKEIDHEIDYEEDPREALMNRLIEYRKYKMAAKELQEKELEENQLYTRAPVLFEELLEKAPVIQEDVSVYNLLEALADVFKRKKWNEPLETKVNRMEISVEERMVEIINTLKKREKPITFAQLFAYPNRTHVVTTFLAILQLIKTNQIQCQQKTHFQPIYISRMEV